MKIGDQSDPKNHQTYGPAQPRVELVWVQCNGYRCLAYRDEAGKWINFYTGKRVVDFIAVIG